MKTIAKLCVEAGGNGYGQKWSVGKYEILQDMELALRADYSSDTPSIQRYISEKLGKTYSVEDLNAVMDKILGTTGKVLREPIPYLGEVEYKRLCDYKKKKKRRVV